MGTIKERSGKDLIEAKVINRWQDTQNYFKKTDLDDPDNHNGVMHFLNCVTITPTSQGSVQD